MPRAVNAGHPDRSRHARLRSAHTRLRLAAVLAAVALLPAGLGGCSFGEDGLTTSLNTFLDGWRSGDLNAVAFIGPDGAKVPAALVAAQIKALSGELAQRPPALRATGEPEHTGNIATQPVNVDWALPGGGRWSYPTAVRLQQAEDDEWRVIWEPAIVQRQLTSGDRLAVRRLPARRASILDGAGQPLVLPRPVVVVGVTPQQITDVTKLVKDLGAAFASLALPVDLKDLPTRVTAADPGAFVEVAVLRKPDYDRIRTKIRPLPGTVFRPETRDLAPSRAFARALLGAVGEATKEDLQNKPDQLAAGDIVGHGGLQERYDAQLRGTPGEAVVVVQEAPDGTITDTALFRTDPRTGTPVKTTLDGRIQDAADAALSGQKRRSALVAVRVRDGLVLAVANAPVGDGDNLAFTAQVPPGSTFKAVSALGLLDRGAVTRDRLVDCPRRLEVDGRAFRNANNMALGQAAFWRNFSRSCNTAFAGLAPKLGADGLTAAGASLGLGAPWDLGVAAFSGRVSAGGSPAERAAAAFGQGTTVVSPLAMAGATASVARGEFRQPRVLLDPAPARPAPNGPPLKATSVEPLRTMMRDVVTRGTGSALLDVPGKPVHGKTGTAEFADGQKTTHAWFIGWQGDVAFAVFVENGGSGSDVAIPIAERFLRKLA